jgi:hypothetical protein
MGAAERANAGGRNKCEGRSTRIAMGSGTPIVPPSIMCLGRAMLLGLLCLPAMVMGSWVGRGLSSAPAPAHLAAFGYALPSRYSPPSFYPPNAPPPLEETHFDEAVAAARQSRASRVARFPSFPETPTALAHEISGG